ncbi:regulator of telomere elongation helicase 1-like [Gigantopelta aegis]|uniref:regulator of telomere elongation helicase 1-like n=1 Tax=Gigantopelta aegis TaxID=1735272 RepID=UPI001B88D0C0|nr:regulator of telomere elongation helicase 1-like [Gigantopelta aegis]XP_041359590.1 regulator of telomere elongation helicase 1-like [Gigantopelta aegis]
MPSLSIKGVQVDFPFDPYACQLTYMEKVIECLQTGVNGILESPTGTGKTLCLLCSSLAWLVGKKAAVEFKKQTGLGSVLQDRDNLHDDTLKRLASKLQESSGSTWGTSEFVVPKIIYASRTHSQLSQAVQELKRTTYNSVKACVLGSREQFCIHDQVRKEPNNTAKVHMCRAKVQTRRCFFYNTLEDQKRTGDPRSGVGNVVDIEDLVKHGEKTKVCPYYLARELKTDADIIFMPYNYLLDPKSRRAHGVELQGNILILDEAHNLEKICEESSSFDLTSVDLATAIEETTRLMEKIIDLSEIENQVTEFGDSTAIEPDFTLEDLIKLKAVLKDLEDSLDTVEIPKNGPGLTKPGMFIFELLSRVGITFESKNYLLDLLEKLVSYLTNEGAGSVLHTKGAGLGKFNEILRIVFSQEPSIGASLPEHQERIAKFYKVHIHFKEEIAKKKKIDSWATSGDSDKKERVLSYWCFSPGHSMKDLEAHGVKSIILTSGTLSPLSSFSMEMQIPFPVTLENPHVIQKYQVSVNLLGKGPDGTVLNSSYQTRFDPAYQSSLGNSIVNFARVVPNGLLVFFPSYPVMDKCVEFWKDKNIWNRITQYKAILVEPKGKVAFNNVMDEFYNKIQDTTLNGAIFMAVCRGKVSEGLDFSDINGRAVVITGLPYPPRMDPKVLLKMQFLNEMRKGLSGNEWYRQQASRAVNQAIGRVIRHKDDFGAIILCDTRFSSSDFISQLPVWVRPYIIKHDNFGHVMRDVMAFFKNTEKLMPVQVTNKRRTNQNCEGAHFQSTLSRTAQKQTSGKAIYYEQASTVVCHVPTMRQDRSNELSEQQRLSRVYNQGPSQKAEKKGLIQALEFSEKTSDDSDFLSETQIPSHQPIKTNQPKRRRIVIKKPNEQTVSCSVMVETKPISSVHVNKAEDYIKEVKKILKAESYKVFSKALIEYRKMENLEKVSSVLADLFTEDPANHHLFRKFYNFARPHHKQQFDEICVNLTGMSCGYTPEHSAAKRLMHSGIAEPAGKRCKTNSSSEYKNISGCDGITAGTSRSKLTSASEVNKPNVESSDKQTIQQLSTGLTCIPSSVTLNGLENNDCSKMQDTKSKVCFTTRVEESKDCTKTQFKQNNSPSRVQDIENIVFSKSQITESNNSGSKTQLKESNNISKTQVKKSINSPKTPSTSVLFTDNRLTDTNCETKPGVTSVQVSAVSDKTLSENCEKCSGDGKLQLSAACDLSNDVERCENAIQMSQTTARFSKSGYTCGRCGSDAHIPFEASCSHVCCYLCWKQVIKSNKMCPGCGAPVRRRDLKQLLFTSGPNVE